MKTKPGKKKNRKSVLEKTKKRGERQEEIQKKQLLKQREINVPRRKH